MSIGCMLQLGDKEQRLIEYQSTVQTSQAPRNDQVLKFEAQTVPITFWGILKLPTYCNIFNEKTQIIYKI
jgi:hypothetical protein